MSSSAAAAPVVVHLQNALGLSFSGPRRARLLASVEEQRVASGLSPEAFLAASSDPGPLFDRLVDRVTVGETYFFRDRQQCELLRTLVLPRIAARTAPSEDVAVWSAGCASGEEAYTLAALADAAGLGERTSVVGSDVSRASLDKAAAGAYGRWSMRGTTDAERAGCFREQRGVFRVTERLRRRVAFVQRNLLDGPPPPGAFDVVLCRNLLIYLTREGVQRVGQVLADALTDDGWLLTAAGDPPLTAPGLVPVRTPFGLAYRRAEAVPAELPGTVPGRTSRPAPGPARPSSAGTGLADVPVEPAQVCAVPEPAPLPGTPAEPSAAVAVQAVRALGDAGRLVEACVAAEAATRVRPLDVELRYVTGALLLEAGRLEDASVAAGAAVYLSPDSPAAHLLLGQVQHSAGQVDRARRSFRTAVRLLAVTPSETPVALAVGVPAGHLAAVAQHYLDTVAVRA